MEDIAIVAVLIAIGVLASEWMARHSVSLPIIFLLGGWILGQHVLSFVDLSLETEVVKELTELTLALLLFADASTLRRRRVQQEAGIEGRLLSIGLLLTIALGGLLAFVFFPDDDLGIVLLIGAALAPTDAALGLPIFTNRNIPVRIRQSLNVESGLNDGIVTPFVTLFIALAVSEVPTSEGGWLADAASELLLGVTVGVVVGVVGGWLIRAALSRNYTSPEMAQIAFFSLSIAAFFGSRELDGNGFIAAFVAGLFCGTMLKHSTTEAAEFTETAGTGASLFVWAVFGASLVPLALDEALSWQVVVFAILALTVMRMIPVAIAMIGTGFRRDTIAIMGWFGPRGLASVVFLVTAIVALEEGGLPLTLIGAMTWTIGLSVILHGISAGPLARWYGARIEKASDEIPERATATTGVEPQPVLRQD
ncbi:MAG TPA: cation:proton antiporter [Thermomicrobiales bacterium]|nr:cation:proton antiporter [Thermomicrobiales bacterium]